MKRTQRLPALTLVIDKGVPLPVRAHRSGVMRQVLEKMQPGDSFALPPDFRMATLYSAARLSKIRICRRRVPLNDGADWEMRVWRLS